MGTSTLEYTWYVRDASGNVMAGYNSTGTGAIAAAGYTLNLTEQHLYGSSRLGVLNRNIAVKNVFVNPGTVTFTRGNKFFELSNHLQNVLVTVSDKKIPVSTNGTTVVYYKADIITVNDYYPFGSLQPGRNYNAPGKKDYKYGFNGKENDNDVKGIEGGQQDYGMRIYDPRLGRFLSVDPLTRQYPMLTPYQFASNDPIESIDLDGLERHDYRLIIEDGKPKLEYQGSGVSEYTSSFLFFSSTTKIPSYIRVEYNGQHYSFADGRSHKELKAILYEEYRPKSLYYMKDYSSFMSTPNSFTTSHMSDEQIAGEENSQVINSMAWSNATTLGQTGLPRPPGSDYLPSPSLPKTNRSQVPAGAKIHSIYSDGVPVISKGPPRLSVQRLQSFYNQPFRYSSGHF
jgi:RHS repeat-associated protein